MSRILHVGPRGRACTDVQYSQQGRHLEHHYENPYAYAAVGFQWVLYRGGLRFLIRMWTLEMLRRIILLLQVKG